MRAESIPIIPASEVRYEAAAQKAMAANDDQADMDALCRACFGPLTSEERALAEAIERDWLEEHAAQSERRQTQQEHRDDYREEC